MPVPQAKRFPSTKSQWVRDTLGLALVIQFDLRNEPLEGLVPIEVKGPAGWNNNQVLKLEAGFLGNATGFTPEVFLEQVLHLLQEPTK